MVYVTLNSVHRRSQAETCLDNNSSGFVESAYLYEDGRQIKDEVFITYSRDYTMFFQGKPGSTYEFKINSDDLYYDYTFSVFSESSDVQLN